MTVWVRAPVLDEYTEDNEGVLFLESGEVVALNPIAWSLWCALADGPRAWPDILNGLTSEHGVPTSRSGEDLSGTLVQGLLDELHDAGVIAVSRDESP